MGGVREEVPVSADAVRRLVLNTVQEVEKETQTFCERYLQNAEPNSAQWTEYVQNACEQIAARPPGEMQDFKDLDPVLNRLRGEEMSGYAEYNQLRRMIERGRMFEYITFSLKNELEEAYRRTLRVYCLSFVAEAKGESLESVTAYQERVEGWEAALEERFGRLDELLDEYDAVKCPLLTYMQQYDRATELMKGVCEAMGQCTEPMKKWVKADATYPQKVQEEINTYNRRKMDMRDVIKELEDQRDELGMRLKKRAQAILKVDQQMGDSRDEKKYFKRRENHVQNNLMKTRSEISRKTSELDEIKQRLHGRKKHSPTTFNYLASTQETLRDEIRILEGKADVMEAQKASLQKDQARCQRDLEKLSVELDRQEEGHRAALRAVEAADEEVQAIKEDVKRLDEEILALKKIREIKLHSSTVKKIFHYGYTPGEMTEYTDELQEAFKLTAEDVGKDWVSLYQKLPFHPRRDQKSRIHDIEVIDLSNRRLDGGFQTLAIKSLEKWRRLSEQASVGTLLATLRKIRKQNTARRIELSLASIQNNA